jgi:uncharacterized iron-regulated protein
MRRPSPVAAAMTVPRVRATSARGGVNRRGRWAALLASALVLAGCAGTAPTPVTDNRKPLAFGPDADLGASARLVAARAESAEVVYLGELHDNPQHHAIQAGILEALLAAGVRPALAFEMVPETRQAALEAAVRSDAGPAEVDRQLGWSDQGWPDFAMYWPLFELARKHRLPVVGTDLDPAVARRIGRDGLGAAGPDPARLRSALRDDPVRDQAIARRLRAAHCDQITEDRATRMLEGWYARNVVIARRVSGGLERASQVVVIIGRGHQSPGGVPEQLGALRPGTRQLVVGLFEGEADGPTEPLSDVAWVTPGRSRPNPCLSLPQRLGGLTREGAKR